MGSLYNVYYYVNGVEEAKEFYAIDLNNPLDEIRQGYTQIVD